MLVLNNEEIASMISMQDCLRVLKDAYQALREETALNTPRVDSIINLNEQEGTVYSFKTMGGVIQQGVQALRINSDVVHWPDVTGQRRRVKVPAANGRWVGLVYLFDPSTGMPLAIMPDGVIQHYRVGAANGLAAQYLAPVGAKTAALLGSGWQAQTQLLALDAVLGLQEVRVFSPNPNNCEFFCHIMQQKTKARLISVSSAWDAVKDAEVVCSATNSMSPVLLLEWIRPGVHFSTIKAQEVGADFFPLVHPFLHTVRQAKAEVISAGDVPNFEKEQGWWRRPEVRSYPDLTDLISGKVVGRQTASETTLFVNNVGMGLQFAAVGGLILEKARELKLGRELPDDWFTENVHP